MDLCCLSKLPRSHQGETGVKLKSETGPLRIGAHMGEGIYDYNILVSCSWGDYRRAQEEVIQILTIFGDESPFVGSTLARGVIGAKTRLDSRLVISRLRELFNENPMTLQYALKWVPVDLWTRSDIESMKEGIKTLRSKIGVGEPWRMTVEKRRYNLYHKMEIIEELAELIKEKVDLENPEKILRVDIIGKYAGISVLAPRDVFSVARSYRGRE